MIDKIKLARAIASGHFVALRWLIWPQNNKPKQDDTSKLPEVIFKLVMELTAHGLKIDIRQEKQGEQ